MINTVYSRTLSTKEKTHLDEIYKLRYRVFVQEKRWRKETVSKMESDDYDMDCTFITLYMSDCSGNETLIGVTRVIPLTNDVMLDRDFAELVPNVVLDRESGLEITRFAIDKEFRHYHLDIEIYKRLFLWTKENNIKNWYFVVEPKYLKYLKRLKIAARQIGVTKVFDDGVMAIAVHMNIKEVMEKLEIENKELYDKLQDL